MGVDVFSCREVMVPTIGLWNRTSRCVAKTGHVAYLSVVSRKQYVV